MVKYEPILYAVHVSFLSVMCFGRVTLNMLGDLNHQGHHSEDLQNVNIMQKKRFWYLFGSILITIVLTIMNGMMLDRNIFSPLGLVYGAILSLFLELFTRSTIFVLNVFEIGIDASQAMNVLFISSFPKYTVQIFLLWLLVWTSLIFSS